MSLYIYKMNWNKIVTCLLTVGLMSVVGQIGAQGIDFFQGSFQEALETAKKEDKAVFVDAYTTWCGPCKRMSKYVFTEEKVGDYYNSNFVNLKLNMEKEEGMKFKLKYPVSAYPTLYYISPDGEVLHVTKGGRQPDQFIDLGKKALLKYDRSSEFAELYEGGDRSFNTVYNYVKALNKSGKPSLKIVNDYLAGQKDLTTNENLQIIFEGMTRFDSRVYDLFSQYEKQIRGIVDAEVFDHKIKKVSDQTVQKAIEFKEVSLLETAQKERAKFISSDTKSFDLSSNMDYAVATQDQKMYLKNAKKFCKKFGKDASTKNRMVKDVLRDFKGNNPVMEWAAKTAKAAAEQGGLSEYYLHLGYTQFFLDQKDEALKSAEKAVALAKEQKTNDAKARALIGKLK